MGLDVEFIIPGQDDSSVYMRNHWSFFSMFPSQGAGLVDENFDDFWVDEDVLDEVEETLLDRYADIDSERHFTEDEVLDLLRFRGEKPSLEVRKPLYLQILRDLRALVDEHGPLICAWSA